GGKHRNATGVVRAPMSSAPPKTVVATPTTTMIAASASAGRRRRSAQPGSTAQTMRNGATTSAPAASPSHQVSQIGANVLHGAYPASARLVTPMVALTAVATIPAERAKAKMLRGNVNAATPLANRRTSQTPRSASSVFPTAIPSDVDAVPA